MKAAGFVRRVITAFLFLAGAALATSPVLAAGPIAADAKATVRYSSPYAGTTPEIPVNAQGLPALPDEPQVLGSGRRNMRPAPSEAVPADGTLESDPLTVYGSYEEMVEAVGFDMGYFVVLPENYTNTAFRGLPGVVMEIMYYTDGGDYVIVRRGVGYSDIGRDLPTCDEATVYVGDDERMIVRTYQGTMLGITYYKENSTWSVLSSKDISDGSVELIPLDDRQRLSEALEAFRNAQ